MRAKKLYRIGVDVGSTTLKVVVLSRVGEIVHKTYKRHKADFNSIFIEELRNIEAMFPDSAFSIAVTGSAGMGIAERTGLSFTQEVVASIEVIKQNFPYVKAIIDLGGEDAKMVFFEEDKQPDIRMNGNCAGGGYFYVHIKRRCLAKYHYSCQR